MGRTAEKRFSALCSDQAVTCNEPGEDDHGWDHIVEFPQRLVAGRSADMQRGLPAVFVQTKTHEGRSLRVTMKFSNALKLARSPSPCFVLLLSKAANGTDQWYAVHFWEKLIARVLKRAREATRDGIAEENFNHQSFSFTMTDTDLHKSDKLLPWMVKTVLAVGPDYAAAKQSLHGGQEIVGVVKIGPLGSIDELVDHQLGLTTSIPMASVKMSLRRFGVDLPFPLPIPAGPMTFASMQSNPATICEIRLRGPDGAIIETTGEVIAPSIPNIPKDKVKIRIRAPFFDIIWHASNELQFTAKFDSRVKANPSEIEKMARFLSWSGQGEIDLRIWVEGEMLLGAATTLNPHEGHTLYGALADHAQFLSMLAINEKTSGPQISMDDIMDSEEADALLGFVKASSLDMSLELYDGQEWHDIDSAIASGAGAYGEWIFAAIQRFPILEQKRDGTKVVVSLGKPILLESCAFKRSDAEAIDRFERDFHRYANKPKIFGIQNVIPRILKPAKTQS